MPVYLLSFNLRFFGKSKLPAFFEGGGGGGMGLGPYRLRFLCFPLVSCLLTSLSVRRLVNPRSGFVRLTFRELCPRHGKVTIIAVLAP